MQYACSDKRDDGIHSDVTKLYAIVLSGLLLRLVVAMWNGFWGPSFGADLDALAFHEYAVRTARGESGDMDFLVGWIYAFFLGKVYWVFGDSLFLGGILSCIAWLFSGLMLIKIIGLLKIPRRNALWIVGIYAILPGSILLTAVTLREAYQMLFVNGILLSGLYLLNSFRIRYLVIFVLCGVGAGMLHSAIAAYAVLSLIALLVMPYLFAGSARKWLLIMLPAVALTPLLLGAIVPSLESGLALAVAGYREGTLLDARADYSSDVNIESLGDLLMQFPYLVFQYLFEPMPWKISSILDIYVLAENVLRLYLLTKAIAIVRSKHPNRLFFVFLVVNYFLLEAIWALGTNNWGTALRHHLPMLGCLLLIGLGGRDLAARRERRAIKGGLTIPQN